MWPLLHLNWQASSFQLLCKPFCNPKICTVIHGAQRFFSLSVSSTTWAIAYYKFSMANFLYSTRKAIWQFFLRQVYCFLDCFRCTWKGISCPLKASLHDHFSLVMENFLPVYTSNKICNCMLDFIESVY